MVTASGMRLKWLLGLTDMSGMSEYAMEQGERENLSGNDDYEAWIASQEEQQQLEQENG